MPANTLVRPVTLSLRPLSPANAGCTAIPTTRLRNISHWRVRYLNLFVEPAEQRRIDNRDPLQNSRLNYDRGAMNLHLHL
jgi:hypothetical protein